MSGDERQRQVIFTDLRHIRCGDLQWHSPDGTRLPLISPPPPMLDAHAHTGVVPYGVRLAAQRATKTEPLRPSTRLGRVVFEDGRYRSWYIEPRYPPNRNFGSYSTDLPETVSICAVESRDGFEWSEPTRSPIDAPGQSGFDGFTFFVDPQAPEEERFKAVYSAIPPQTEWRGLWETYEREHPRYRDPRFRPERLWCMYGLTSPDGKRWTALREPQMIHLSDTDTTVYFDTWLERYVMYTRLYWQERRWIGRAESTDFRAWGPVEAVVWPGPGWSFSDDIYTNARCTYPGLPSSHLMFPMVYHRFDQTSDIHLYASPDGICWNQVPGGPVVAPGEAGEWDCAFIGASKDLVPFGDGRVGLTYHGTAYPHKYPRWPGVLEAGRTAWAWWPDGRLSAVVADHVGEFHTVAAVPTGRQLRLNVRARRGGEVRVGIVGVAGREADACDPIYGNDLTLPVHWGGQADGGFRDDEAVTLHFKLRSAELFGFSWV